MTLNDAHIKQLAAVGYNKEDLCRKFGITMFQFVANYIRPYREGQHIYVQKEMKRYDEYNKGNI